MISTSYLLISQRLGDLGSIALPREREGGGWPGGDTAGKVSENSLLIGFSC